MYSRWGGGIGMELLVKKRIKQVLKGDQNAYEEIVEIYKDKVLSISPKYATGMLGNLHEAEDIAQEPSFAPISYSQL